MNTGKANSGDSVWETEKTLQRPYFVGDVFNSRIHAASDNYNTTPNVNPESSLQRYWIEVGFLGESQAVKLEDEAFGRTNDGGITEGTIGNSLLQKRRRGRPRKVNTTTAMHTKDDQPVKMDSRGGCTKRITRSTAKGLASSGSVAGTGHLQNWAGHSHRKERRTTAHVKATPSEGTTNRPKKRGRPRKHPLVDLLATELCTACYNKFCEKFRVPLYDKVLRLKGAGSALPSKREVGKQPRDKQRELKEMHPVHLRPKEEVDCPGVGPSNLDDTNLQ